MGIAIVAQINCSAPLLETIHSLEKPATRTEQVATIQQIVRECAFETIPTLIKLAKSSDTAVKNQMLFALGELRAFEATGDLIEMANKHDTLFPSILNTLAQIGTSSSIDYIISQISSSDPQTRIYALSSLRHAPSHPLITKIGEQLMTSDPDIGVKQQVDNLQGRFPTPHCKIRKKEADLSLPSATKILRGLERLQSIELIRKANDVSLPANVSSDAIKELDTYPQSPQIKEALIKALVDDREEVRLAALYVERSYRDPDALPLIHNLLEDESPRVRNDAFSIATTYGNNTTLDRFHTIASNKSSRSRILAAKSIGICSRQWRSSYGLTILGWLTKSTDHAVSMIAKEELAATRKELDKPQRMSE